MAVDTVVPELLLVAGPSVEVTPPDVQLMVVDRRVGLSLFFWAIRVLELALPTAACYLAPSCLMTFVGWSRILSWVSSALAGACGGTRWYRSTGFHYYLVAVELLYTVCRYFKIVIVGSGDDMDTFEEED